MPMKSILRALVAAGIMAGVGLAQEISGAVGVTLGAPFPSDLPHSTNAVPGRLGYRFSPTNAPAPFKDFVAGISPRTGLVYLVSGKVAFSSKQEAEIEYEKMQNLLAEKYGKPYATNAVPYPQREFLWRQGNRGISLLLEPNGPSLTLNYADEDLVRKANREEIESRAKLVDKSGL